MKEHKISLYYIPVGLYSKIISLVEVIGEVVDIYTCKVDDSMPLLVKKLPDMDSKEIHLTINLKVKESTDMDKFEGFLLDYIQERKSEIKLLEKALGATHDNS